MSLSSPHEVLSQINNISHGPDVQSTDVTDKKSQRPRPKKPIIIKFVLPIDQTWTIERIATEQPPSTWERVFDASKNEIKDISEMLNDVSPDRYLSTPEGPAAFFPLKRDIFRAFDLTPINCVKAVIVGQDPYPQQLSNGLPRAVGLSFSVRRNDGIPSSLRNIYNELENSIPGFIRPSHGDLTEWALQGILMLNMSLTVFPGQPDSHSHLWMGFIINVLKALAECRPDTIYILLGKNAQRLQKYIGDRAVVVTAPHPSGLSRGFVGSGVFKQVNDILKERNKSQINWQITN